MPSIAKFSIQSLNDFFTYSDCSAQGSLEELMILYGENGSGKTSILNLLFHLLSSQTKKGHLTYIAETPFKSLRVELSDGTVVSATRDKGVSSIPIEFAVTRPGEKRVQYLFIPADRRDAYLQELFQKQFIRTASASAANKVKDWRNNDRLRLLNLSGKSSSALMPHSDEFALERYWAAIRSIGITPYLVPTDRSIKSDAVEIRPSPMRFDPARDDAQEIMAKARAALLREALAAATRYLTKQIIKATNVGSKNTNDIFTELIRRVAADGGGVHEQNFDDDLTAALADLESLEINYSRFSRLGIAPELNFESLIPVINNASPARKPIIEKIIRPYIDSLSARLKALNPVGDSIETFLDLLNGLLSFKKITFSPAGGFQMDGPCKEKLDPGQLSSGEQQLLLMFCYLLASRESDCIFMIDEPEISLNVRWQRLLVEYMKKIVRGTNCQLIVATHSIELLTQYSDKVVALDPSISAAGIRSNEATAEDN